MSEQQRFFSHVIKGPNPESCWIWTGAISDDGYGIFWRKHPQTGADAPMRAHRYALSLIAPAGDVALHALHKCDNTLCVKATADSNTHLAYGTRAENMADRARRRTVATITGGVGKKQRAAAARKLRQLTLDEGYQQFRVDELMKGVYARQEALF